MISYQKFFDCKSPEFCYLLGFLWADGYAFKNGVDLNIVHSDGIFVKKILDLINIPYRLYYVKSKKGSDGIIRKSQDRFCFGTDLSRFLITLNYDKKSFYSHRKVMESIPEENLHYWLRGYFDGDGCFHFRKAKGISARTFSFCSCYEQDWEYLNNFLMNLDIKTTLRRKNYDYARSSTIESHDKKSIFNFGQYIYQGKQFGLNRKKEKYISMI